MKNTTTQTIENQQVMNQYNGHAFQDEIKTLIDVMKIRNEQEDDKIEMTITTPNPFTYCVYNGDKMLSQHAKITQQWESIEEFFTSPEMIERFECYDHVRMDQLRLSQRWEKENTFKFMKGIQIGDKLFKVYKSVEQGIIMAKEITIGSCLSTMPFHQWSFQSEFNSVSVYPRHWTKDRKHRKTIADMMIKLNENSFMVHALNDSFL